MILLKKALKAFLSLRTAVWLLVLLLAVLFYGSLIVPFRPAFQQLYIMPLFRWMVRSPLGITWWLWVSIAVLSLLTANTIVCSIDSILRKRGARNWLLVISPQITHIGFLFILLAHLLSSYGSFKAMTYAYEGSALRLPDGQEVLFDRINTDIDPSGYLTDWSADITYYQNGKAVANDVVRPNSPSFRDGWGLYIRTVRMAPYTAALVEVSREPGAPFALTGGILFLAGMFCLLALKAKREESPPCPT